MSALRAALVRGLALAVVWWAVTEGDVGTWVYGVVVVPLVAAATLVVSPPTGRRLRLARRAVPGVRLAAWFVRQSLLGAVDVGVRAVQRPVRIDPVTVEHPLSLPAGTARVLCAQLYALMPGTLTVDLRDDVLVAHVLDRSTPWREHLDDLQARIAAVLEA
ncbi:Na+/H+ antiporter subunit E [Cellulomonas phragmiteti]|uniref:Cation transporter n=1 Tax=Cellulomonas phragmiteti TaxID=478780 RepID=A0ABQ4DNF8_9CELL|nr:Na+/H+ antiporter subunit E [Cellulomonas phragmiteti]GIG40522.1 hypothetical protein Cph01nite_22840 [Cellulomonas phragmiteti]